MKFLDTILGNSFVVIYAVTLVMALFRYRKYYETPLQYLPILLLYTLLNEILGLLVVRYDYFDLSFEATYENYNVIIYSIYNIVFFLYFYYLFRSYAEKMNQKKQIFFIGILFCVIALFNVFIQDITTEHQILTYLFGGITMIYLSISYLKSISIALGKKDILFWISIGLLVFFIGYLPIKVIRYLKIENIDYMIVWRVHMLLILAMYSCFIIGFLRMREKLKKPIIESEYQA
ncbi:hypothetical protein FEE95_00500 [Maribacter algarum]|uniref:Histidine kinase N-terminal 7TM region domain-containing protein n=1 Tax=Maribacter algarum (ex Zhang et al. 2020) TaxID=2578118 RepID=A0A5S3QJE3_9FLAO|nr:hypothetical protein [Maribacter algarum]TMM57944.1 hypothetical protein FEE95_00500 [Maribacter algarum]